LNLSFEKLCCTKGKEEVVGNKIAGGVDNDGIIGI
jgi:hypothetical protein